MLQHPAATAASRRCCGANAAAAVAAAGGGGGGTAAHRRAAMGAAADVRPCNAGIVFDHLIPRSALADAKGPPQGMARCI